MDGVIIISGDIDFYPLISWLKEHTQKDVYLLSLKGRLNENYKKMIHINASEFDVDTNMDFAVLAALSKVHENDIDENDLDWLKNIEERTKSKILKASVSHQKLHLLKKNKENIIKNSEHGGCRKFIEKVLEGISSWLNKKDYLSTGLIIKNWLPRWKLDITPEQANLCLKKFINSEKLERIGYKFTPEESQSGELIIGKITKL